MATAPRFPNVHGVIDSTLPVVTALLAGLSSAAFLVPLSGNLTFRELDMLGRIRYDSSDAAIVFGVVATASFVAASVSSVYAHAQDFELIPEPKKATFMEDHKLDCDHYLAATRKYSEDTLLYYRWIRFLFIVGLSFFALTIASLTFGDILWLGPVGAFTSIVISILPLRDADFTRAQKSIAAVVLVVSLASFVGTLPEIVTVLH